MSIFDITEKQYNTFYLNSQEGLLQNNPLSFDEGLFIDFNSL